MNKAGITEGWNGEDQTEQEDNKNRNKSNYTWITSFTHDVEKEKKQERANTHKQTKKLKIKGLMINLRGCFRRKRLEKKYSELRNFSFKLGAGSMLTLSLACPLGL